MKIVGVLINVLDRNQKNVSVSHIDDSNGIDDYYKLLKCSIFDIVTRKIGSRYYDIYCDDEGLLKNNPIASAIDENGNSALFGNLFVTKTDEEGNTISLTSEEIEEVTENTITVIQHGYFYDILALN